MPRETRQTDNRGKGASCQEHAVDLIERVMDRQYDALQSVPSEAEQKPRVLRLFGSDYTAANVLL